MSPTMSAWGGGGGAGGGGVGTDGGAGKKKKPTLDYPANNRKTQPPATEEMRLVSS